MADAEKLEKLKEKYNQLKQANKVLKEGLLEQQDSNSRLETQMKEKDVTLRQQMEDIDHLQFQNGRVSKQLGSVTSQLEELKQRQTQQSGWSVGGLISGKQQQEAVAKAEEEIRALRDELMMRIGENEDLHCKLFEQKQAFEEDIDKLKGAQSAAAKDLEAKAAELNTEQQECKRLRREVEDKTQELDRLNEACAATNALADSLRSTLEAERLEAQRSIEALCAEIQKLQPFDESRHNEWNAWNYSSRQGQELHRKQQAVQHLQASIVDTCKQSSTILQMWAKTFGGGGDGESGARLRMKNKMSDAVDHLAKMVGEQLPALVGSIEMVHMLPTSAWERDFKASSRELLHSHRKWVMYQSLLLLHDWNSSYAARSAQEEAQAQRFVDWLWRLHRCIRALFMRFGVLRCVQALSTSSSSAAHFALIGSALHRRPKDTKTGQRSPGSIVAAVASKTSGNVAPLRSTAGISAAMQLVRSLRQTLQDITQCWEGIGRCLSAWAAVQANQSGAGSAPQERGSIVELLEMVHRFNACLADRMGPAMGKILEGLPRDSHRDDPSACVPPLPPSSSAIGRPGAALSRHYILRAGARLSRAPAALGFEQALETQQLSRRLSATGERLSSEVRQQVRRLQVVSDEKANLAEELRALQDNHALLRSNFQVLQERGTATASTAGATSGSLAAPSAAAAVAAAAAQTAAQAAAVAMQRPAPGPGSEPWPLGAAHAELVLSSRQRALMESLSVTAQEGASLRQHGYFVEVISLTPSDVALASSCAPETADATDASSWEAAVRRVYEQHARQLQAQIRAADAKAMELHLSTQRNVDLLRQEETTKQRLRNEAEATRAQLLSLEEDMATTRKNYDNQLAMLTEHICTLSTNLSDKDASLASMQTQKVLCGRCGMWNTMGKLLAMEGGGTCQTCKEKVLSRS